MDFRSRGTGTQQTVQPASQPAAGNTAGAVNVKHKGSRREELGKWTRVGYAVLLFAITIIIVSIAGIIAFGSNNESNYVNTSKYQAVFLNDGSTSGQSVYFGHIVKVTDKYLVLQDIYYITTPSSTTSSTSSSSNYQLTKLGCQQLHDPYDQMVINQDQVAFWENLQDSGKVVSTITQFQKDNPNGPNCSETSSSSTSTGTTQSTATTPSTTTTAPSTSTTTPTTTPSTTTTTK